VGTKGVRPTGSAERLTQRELAVLELIAQGLTNGAIAGQLSVSVHTVKFHLGSVYRKLGVSNRTEATAFFLQQSHSHLNRPSQSPADGLEGDGSTSMGTRASRTSAAHVYNN